MRTVLLAALAAAAVQAQPDTRARFEAVSVKPSTGPEPQVIYRPYPPGKVNLTHSRLKNIITEAYGVQRFLVFGGPGWLDTDPYDIVGELPAAVPPPPISKSYEALQVLLEDRFKLRVHWESRVMPLYYLTIAKGGTKLVDGAELPDDVQGGYRNRDTIRVVRRKEPLSSILAFLSSGFGMPIEDRTGLTGTYSFVLLIHLESAPAPSATETPQAADDPNNSAVIAALRTQLGLNLEKGKGPVRVLVIDSADRPAAN